MSKNFGEVRIESDSKRFVTRVTYEPAPVQLATMLLTDWIDQEDANGYSAVSTCMFGQSLTPNSGVRVLATFKRDEPPSGY